MCVCVCVRKKQTLWLLCLHSHTHKIIGLHVRVDQEFLPSQSGPIRWKLTCALTPLGESQRAWKHQVREKKNSHWLRMLLNAAASRSRCPQLVALFFPHCPQKLIQRVCREVMGSLSPRAPQVGARTNSCLSSKRPTRACWVADGSSDWYH